MADEAPLGTDRLRQIVGSARATAGGAYRAPALPPDQMAAPWETPPEPDALTTQRARMKIAAEEAQRQIERPPPPPPKHEKPVRLVKPKPPPERDTRTGWALVQELMMAWGKDSEHSLTKANGNIARRLAQNGPRLLQRGIPLDKVADLIRLCNELMKNVDGESEEDSRIAAIQAQLKREIPDLGDDDTVAPAEAEEADGDAQ